VNRVINNPDQVVEDSLKGYLAAHPELLAPTDHPRRGYAREALG